MMAIDIEFVAQSIRHIADELSDMIRMAGALARIDDREERLFHSLMIAEAGSRIADYWVKIARPVADGIAEFVAQRFRLIVDEQDGIKQLACEMASIENREERLRRLTIIVQAGQRIANLWRESAAHMNEESRRRANG